MKRVVINEDLNTVRVLVHWDFAHRQARQWNFSQIWADRVRFERRITNLEQLLTPILAEEHRNNVYNNRFLK